jgi:hypothetical protein
MFIQYMMHEVNPTLDLIHNVCLVLSLIAVGISIRLIFTHLRHFSQPIIQRKIVAILWMVPVYASTSWFSLRFVKYSIYLDIPRDCYESYAIYMFFALCYCYIGQQSRNTVNQDRIYSILAERGVVSHLFNFPAWTGIEKHIDLTTDPRKFLLRCKINILQFVLIKPLSAIAVYVLKLYFDNYETGNFCFTNGYIYVTTIVNISISVSLYWLVMFYQATKESLQPFNPVPKFLCIKGVLFFSYWQSVVITILVKMGVITEIPVINYSVENVSSTVQNALICLEMAIFAVIHHFAFTAAPFYFIPTRFNSDINISEPLVSDIPRDTVPASQSSSRVPLRTSARAMLRNAVDFSDVVHDFQEVAPDMPIVRYLRRNSANHVDAHPRPLPINPVPETKQIGPRPSSN